MQRYENNILLPDKETRQYFPSNIAELYGLDNAFFFGLKTDVRYEKLDTPIAKFRSLYLSALYDTRRPHPEILHNWDMHISENTNISREGEEFDRLKTEYPKLTYMKPILIIKLHSNIVKADEEFISTELFRYADHEKYHGRKIASQVFESICKKCQIDDIKYLYVNDQTTNGWPSTSRLIHVSHLPEEDTKRIHNTCYEKDIDEIFGLPSPSNLVRILNNEIHEELFRISMISRKQ